MTQENLWAQTRPGVPVRDPQLRAGDQDRDAVAEVLRAQHVEGRLDIEELQSRIDRCYQAKTVGELEQLLVDLPPETSGRARAGWPLGRRRASLLWLACAIVTLAAVSAVTGRHVIWLVIPALFFASRTGRLAPRPRRGYESNSEGAP